MKEFDKRKKEVKAFRAEEDTRLAEDLENLDREAMDESSKLDLEYKKAKLRMAAALAMAKTIVGNETAQMRQVTDEQLEDLKVQTQRERQLSKSARRELDRVFKRGGIWEATKPVVESYAA